MELTHSQISEILSNYTSSSEGFVTLQSLIMNSLMFHERELFVSGNAHEQCNGFEFSLRIPRSHSGDFYPVLLGGYATVPTSRTWTSQPKCRGAYIRPIGLKGSTGSTREPST